MPLRRAEKQCWERRGSCNNDCVAQTDGPSGSQRWDHLSDMKPWRRPAARTRPTGPAVSRGAGAKTCSLSGGTSTHIKIKMEFWLSYMHLNCKEEATLDSPTYLCISAVMMKMFETFLVLLRFDKLLLRFLPSSARCVGAGQVSPAVLLSLAPCLSLSPIFSSLTCVISFFTRTSLPLFY